MNKLKKMSAMLGIFLLIGCNTRLTSDLPTFPAQNDFIPAGTMSYAGQVFKQVNTVDLGSIRKYRYAPENKTSSSQIIILFDQNKKTMTLSQRLALRQRIYQHSNNVIADLRIENNTLYSILVYRPSERYPNWGIVVTKGKNIAKCGFIEQQYLFALSDRQINRVLQQKKQAKIEPHIWQTTLTQLKHTAWLWQCHHSHSVKKGE